MFNKSDSELKEQGAVITTREIQQEPDLWLETLDIYHRNKEKLDAFLDQIKAQKDSLPIKVIFTGAGTSAYVGDTVVPYLNQFGDTDNFEFESVPSTSIVSYPQAYLNPDRLTILVSFARSGNSPESVAAVDVCEKYIKNLYQIAITCAPKGQLALKAEREEKNFLLLQPARSEDQGFAMTGSFSCMSLSTILTFGKENASKKDEWVHLIAKAGEEVIEREAEIQKIVDLDYDRVGYLGSGALAGLTREAQLKILELTAGKIATIFDSSMGFRHGPKSFVDNKTIVFDFLSHNEYTEQYDVDILNEMAGDEIAAGIYAIGTQKDSAKFKNGFFFKSELDQLPDGYAALPYVMVAQTFALLSSIKIGNTPDTPSPTGQVNRVVAGVTIHPFSA
ncbi:SIS domain-containing protein [Xylocopilactobacillus apis]|uniref:Tagatose-6-phosphate ketose n=1 Tax=Xylocopilactobacillus apis TaxID=2932183 RepID=A0AAU9CZR3_9LACO|nr:SIS domain-containing protein [Xylocopilactobacillus apis]BDR56773.1 tagatose-6-phosphate ketose [Xylocopilactobacillus apis]